MGADTGVHSLRILQCMPLEDIVEEATWVKINTKPNSSHIKQDDTNVNKKTTLSWAPYFSNME